MRTGVRGGGVGVVGEDPDRTLHTGLRGGVVGGGAGGTWWEGSRERRLVSLDVPFRADARALHHTQE